MRTLQAFAVVLLLAGCSFAQSLTVRPVNGNHLKGFATAGVYGLAMTHGQRFGYLSSDGLSIKDIKTLYSKKDLEKLEARGIKITVTEVDINKVVTTPE